MCLIPAHFLAFLVHSRTASHFLTVDILPLVVLHDASRSYALLDLHRYALQIDHVVRNECVLQVLSSEPFTRISTAVAKVAAARIVSATAYASSMFNASTPARPSQPTQTHRRGAA